MAGIDVVGVWFVRTDLSPVAVERLAATLDAGKRDEVRAYDDARRRRYVAHGAARLIVGRLLAVPPARVRWVRGPHGKPLVAGNAIQLSLSHSGPLAAVAVTRRRAVGVDVQRLLPRLDPVAMARHFPPAEARFVAGAAQPGRRLDRFTVLWARKEACLKAAGGRLADGLRLRVRATGLRAVPAPWRGVVVHDPAGRLPGRFRVRDVPAPVGYRSAVALVGDGPFAVRVRRWFPTR